MLDHYPSEQGEDFPFEEVIARLDGEPNEDPGDQFPEARLDFDRRGAVCLLLEILCAGDASRKVIGARALALQYALKAGSASRNQIELAKRMGTTPARASQILTALEAGIDRICRGN